MIDRDELRRIVSEAQSALTEAVGDYYANVVPDASGLWARVDRFTAKLRLRRRLRRILNDAHFAAAYLGIDGDDLTGRALTETLNAVQREYAYLGNFLDELPTLPKEQAIRRIASYGNAISQTASLAAVADLPELPVQPGDRDLDCHGFCRCHLEVIRTGRASFRVFWRLDPLAEHCVDCERLALQWNPLVIVDGEIVGLKMVKAQDIAALERHIKQLERLFLEAV